MLLVKMLITYDPEDAHRVRDFALATLPETRPETSCLDIINFFQEGKSHMVLVSDFPGDDNGAVGVVTLEDVIEELIGEEIIDESDVFIDVHKAIRRMAPAPRTRIPKGEVVVDSRRPSENKLAPNADDAKDAEGARKASAPELSTSPRGPSFLVQRRSSGHNGSIDRGALRSDDPDLMQHLKHLGPSNAANRPKSTRINTVKIKNIPTTIPETAQRPQDGAVTTPLHAPQGGIGEGLLDNAGREASDGVHSLAVGYGTIGNVDTDRISWKSGTSKHKPSGDEPTSPRSHPAEETAKLIVESSPRLKERSHSVSTVASLPSHRSKSPSPPRKRHTARSGSISENVIDLNGVKKIVLETTSSSDSERPLTGQTDGAHEHNDHNDQKVGSETEETPTEGNKGKKKRKKRSKKKKNGGNSSETQPLLGGERS